MQNSRFIISFEGPGRIGLHTLIKKKQKKNNFIISYGDLASVQALVKVVQADYLTGRM